MRFRPSSKPAVRARFLLSFHQLSLLSLQLVTQRLTQDIFCRSLRPSTLSTALRDFHYAPFNIVTTTASSLPASLLQRVFSASKPSFSSGNTTAFDKLFANHGFTRISIRFHLVCWSVFALRHYRQGKRLIIRIDYRQLDIQRIVLFLRRLHDTTTWLTSS